MDQNLEADVAQLHFTGGSARITPPPGTFAQTAPRRSARGRRDDFLFVTLRISSSAAPAPGQVEHLARLAGDVFFGTPGSVTAALREGIDAVNDHLLDANSDDDQPQLYGSILLAALRGNDFYVAQSGKGQALLIRAGTITEYKSEEAASKPLGTAITPHIRFHHWMATVDDLVLLTTATVEWSEATLSGLSNLALEQAVDRLVATSSEDMTGLLARITQFGQGHRFDTSLSTAAMGAPTGVAETGGMRTGAPLRRTPGGTGMEWRSRGADLGRLLRQQWRLFLRFLANLSARITPGLSEPIHPDMFSRRLLASTAVLVPIFIVAIAALVYYGRGRREQFRENLHLATIAVATAQSKPLDETARLDWVTAHSLINQAEVYGQSEESEAVRIQVEEALDALDLIVRLDFTPLINGGLGSDAEVKALAASATDLYIYNSSNREIIHAWGVPERGYDLDSTFECLGSDERFIDMGAPIDIVIQEEPGALGAEGVVAIDGDGTLIYCAPDRKPAMAQLTPPDIGWGRIQALDVFGDQLYILDPGTNSVWIYEAVGGLFSGNPRLYFVEEVRDLSSAIDLALAQDELVILYADGQLDRCRREQEPDPGGGERIRVECDPEPYFQDERIGMDPTPHIPGAAPVSMDYSAPPEPSLFFLDLLSNSIFHYSMRLVYQGQYFPTEPFPEEISAFTLGPPNDLFIASGSQIYHSQPIR